MADLRFLDVWSGKLWPRIGSRFEELLQMRPAKQDQAVGRHYGSGLLENIVTKSKICGVSCNLAWTDPSKNTALQEDIPLSIVQNFVADTFLDIKAMGPAESASPLPVTSECEPSELADNQFLTPSAVAADETFRNLTLKAKRIWKVPRRCPETLHIPIALTSRTELPEKGHFRRLGMDCAVNGVWLALYWAMEDQDKSAIEALERLILDWQFDFELFEVPEETPNREAQLEANIFAAITNIPLQIERQRDFFGLTGKNMMLICGLSRKLVKNMTAGKVGLQF